ncbi:MAG: hypothetical protein QOC64_3280, partial [Solirubrobacteraceae bacterium]|nr:hypothetical protein [Solirubrobacteraceae bacterium]
MSAADGAAAIRKIVTTVSEVHTE